MCLSSAGEAMVIAEGPTIHVKQVYTLHARQTDHVVMPFSTAANIQG